MTDLKSVKSYISAAIILCGQQSCIFTFTFTFTFATVTLWRNASATDKVHESIFFLRKDCIASVVDELNVIMGQPAR